jgi:serine/threonine-protein kinase
MLEIGSLVDGKYKILNKIGQGGMSIVYLAMNERANKQWAIKEVRKDGVKNYEVVKQGLVVETDMLKRLSHPNLPSIVDVIDTQDTFLIVMDYVQGNPLDKILKEKGAQPQEYVIEWAKQLCDVLGYLHTRKPPIVYRDMKPANVMLKPDGNITLIDFGTAREFKEYGVADTTCLGTQGYAAPEQFGGQGQTDARTDIYTLGATMYHLLTGHNPCEPPYEMYPIRQWNPNLSSGLEEIIVKCTQRNPVDRYQSCAELLFALEHYNELDIEYKKVQNGRFKGFVACASLTVAFGLLSIGSKGMEIKTRADSYENVIREAETATSPAEQIARYQTAIDIDPSRGEAYEGFLSSLQSSDDGLDTTEDAELRSALNKQSKGNKANIFYLKKNEAEYAQFAFNYGMANYYYLPNDGGKSASARWFEEAANAKEVDSKTKSTAELNAKMAKYNADLWQIDQATGEQKVPIADYWQDMKEVTSGNLVDTYNAMTALRIYNDLVNQIIKHSQEFKEAGIKQGDLEKQLNAIQKKIETDVAVSAAASQPEVAKWIYNVSENIESAMTMIENAFSLSASERVAGKVAEKAGEE